MRTIDDGDELRELNLNDLAQEFDLDALYLDCSDLDRAEAELFTQKEQSSELGKLGKLVMRM